MVEKIVDILKSKKATIHCRKLHRWESSIKIYKVSGVSESLMVNEFA